MKRVIEFLVRENGKSPALEFYNSLDDKIKNKFQFLFTRMEEFGAISDPTKFNTDYFNAWIYKKRSENTCKRIRKSSNRKEGI